MFRDKWIIIVSILLGLAAAGGFYVYSSGMLYVKKAKSDTEQKQMITKVKCVVATVDIARRTEVTKDMVMEKEIPMAAAHPDSMKALKDVVGRVAEDRILKDEIVLSANLRASDAPSELSFVLPEGMRAITVAATITGAVGHMIKPGDRVDVVVYMDEKTAGEELSFTLLESMQVLATDMEIIGEEEDKNMLGKSGGKKVETYQSVTIAATPDDCVKLNLAESVGDLKLTLNSSREKENAPSVETVVSISDLKRSYGIEINEEPGKQQAVVATKASGKPVVQKTRIEVEKVEPTEVVEVMALRAEVRDVQIMRGIELDVVTAKTGGMVEYAKRDGVK